jgi:LytR cell envelope-related transcriptional attenuator
MSRTPGSSNGDVARGASFAAAKGALLIGVAVVIGIVLLQQVDNDTKRPVGAATATTKPKTKPTTTTTSAGATTTTTVASAPAKSPAQLRVIVLNGGAASGLAAQMATHLKQVGYTSQPQDANNWTDHRQQGNSVLCKPAFQREAAALSLAVGQGTTMAAYPSTPPAVIQSEVDCIVVVGG